MEVCEEIDKVLGGKILNLNELSKLKDFDIVIFPHGGYVPAAAKYSKSSNLQTRKYTKFIGTEVVGKDSRLTWVAYKYYGNLNNTRKHKQTGN